MSKLVTVAFTAAGYVLGARAGRERYDEIVRLATKVWRNPKVQKGVAEAEQVAKDTGSQMQDKVSDVASKATSKMSEKMS